MRPTFASWKSQPCIAHRVGPLHSPADRNPSYGQVYIYDGNEAVQQRITSVPIRHDARLHNHIVNTIQGMVENHNPFAAAFKCIYGVDLQEYCKAEECREELPEVKKSLDCIKNSQVQLQVD